MTAYDQTFFDYVNAGARRSAAKVVPIVVGTLGVESVLDVGCGQGAWLSMYRRHGVACAHGVDGEYVDRRHLLIPREDFTAHDLAIGFDLGRTYDLVQSLEVAEHLPQARAAAFVAGLVRHGRSVLFSAAPKGQGGDHHVNEQSYDYWRRLFAAEGFVPFDFLRPRILDDGTVEPWYRYNTILYVAGDATERLPDSVRDTRVPDGTPIPDVSPLPYKVRKAVVRLLPVPAMTALAKLKEQWVARRLVAGNDGS